MSENSADLSKQKALLDVPYPRKLYDEIKKGKTFNLFFRFVVLV